MIIMSNYDNSDGRVGSCGAADDDSQDGVGDDDNDENDNVRSK